MLILATIVASSVIIISFCIAYVTNDPEWCQRGGSLIAAISAFMAIFDASTEHDLEHFKNNKVRRKSKLLDVENTNVNLVNRIQHARFRRIQEKISDTKMRSIFWISSIAVVGEIFHGFGDLIFEIVRSLFFAEIIWSFRSCAI